MKTRRIVVPGLDLCPKKIQLPPVAVKHAVRVLRLRANDELLLLDGSGQQVLTVIESATPEAVTVRVLEASQAVCLETPALNLIQAMPKGSKLDEILRRATELGVKSVRPCLSERSIARPDATKAEQRLERWRRIATEASRQCCRGELPFVEPLVSLVEALTSAPEDSLRIILWTGESTMSFATRLTDLEPGQGVTLAIGPEGGFSQVEVDSARELGFAPASLGRLVLRTETAAVAACAIAQHALGAME